MSRVLLTMALISLVPTANEARAQHHTVRFFHSWGSPREIRDMAGVEDLRKRLTLRDGVRLATIKVKAENPPRVLPPRDGVYVKNRFRAALGHAPI